MAFSTIVQRTRIKAAETTLAALKLSPPSTSPNFIIRQAATRSEPTPIPLAPGPPSDNVVIGVTVTCILIFFAILVGIYYWVKSVERSQSRHRHRNRSSSSSSSGELVALRVQDAGLMANLKSEIERRGQVHFRKHEDGSGWYITRPGRVEVGGGGGRPRVSTASSESE